MNLKLYLNTNQGHIPITIQENKTLKSKIYWSFLEVSAGKNTEADNLHQIFQSEFYGSSHFLSDEGFVFNSKSLILTNIFLYVPEQNIDDEKILKKWLQTNSITGLPTLLHINKFSSHSPSKYRYFDPSGKFLIAIDDNKIEDEELLRVKIHKRLDLLFKNQVNCGFILYDPIRSLVRFDRNFKNGDKKNNYCFLAHNVYDYINCITESGYNKMEQKNEELKNKLKIIRHNLSSKDHSLEPVFALDNQCLNLLNNYYAN